ncbi:globin-coupled sensor protein [Sporosarcina sp. FSL K6-2383]|uniref:globin-coupled sensor protein n=1 Tax=Sporosarcina sp. FSL K6-2383 TaxID=2921556 RepID=UPI003159A82E
MMFAKTKSYRTVLAPIQESDIHIKAANPKIRELLKLTQLTQQDLVSLKKIDDIMEEHALTIADRHYDMIMNIPEIKEIFVQHSVKERYTAAIQKYYKQLTKPTLDDAYIDYRKLIGQIHSRIHLTDEWYIGSYIRVYEYLLPYIIARFAKSPVELSEILVALNRIITFDSLIVLGAYQEANDYSMVEKINKVMEYVIGVDQVKDLKDDVDTTIGEAENVSASAQELSASVREVADHAVGVSENTEQMVEEARVGQEVIEVSLNGFLAMGNDFAHTKTKIDALVEEVNDISQVVDFIKNVANQTNLLALNASIEAARAGESGKGFAVVANEVRNLAEQTKESVDKISTAITKMQQESVQVGLIVEEMSTQLGGRISQTKEAIATLDQIIMKVHKVGDATGTIAAIAEEQSAATQEITARIGIVHEHTERIKNQSDRTGESIFHVSLEVDKLRKKTIEEIPELTPTQLERIAQTESLMARWWVYNAEMGYRHSDR